MVLNVQNIPTLELGQAEMFSGETFHLALYLIMGGAILSVMMVLGISNKGQNHWKEGKGRWGW